MQRRDVPRFGLGRPGIWVRAWGSWKNSSPNHVRLILLSLIVGVCPLVLQKLVLSVPVFHGWQGSLGSRSKNFARRGHEANASPGTQPEAPGRSVGLWHQQHPKPENPGQSAHVESAQGVFSRD